MCLYPRLIKNNKYKENKKNKGVIPEVKDKRVLSVPVGCGKCIECRKKKARDWQVRLSEDLRVNKNAKFVTLTFSEHALDKLDREIKGVSGYERDNEICSLAVRRFTERWRKKWGKTIRHWLVTELGGNYTERVHLHGLLWTDSNIAEIREKWQYGRVVLGNGKEHYVSEKTVNYIVKYISKIDEKHKEYKGRIYTSNGIGREYVNRDDSKLNVYRKEGETKETYTTRTGVELGLPVYYRNKIYNEDERESLWLEKLDKEERYVCGVKVDISKGEEEYFKLLEVKRDYNKRMGYGDDEKNWELKRYENQRRNLIKMERIKKLYDKETGQIGRKKVNK